MKLISLLEEGRGDHDVLKAMLDLRVAWATEVELETELARRLIDLLPHAAEAGARFWDSHHYHLVRKKYQSPREVAERLAATLRRSA